MGGVLSRSQKMFLFSFFLLLLLPGPPLLGSRLSVKSPSTGKPLGLVPALAPAVILNRGPRSATPLRSGATLDITTTTPAGRATTACPSSLVDVLPLQALAATMAAVLVVLEPASNLTLRSATALRSTVTLDMTLISAGTETTALTR